MLALYNESENLLSAGAVVEALVTSAATTREICETSDHSARIRAALSGIGPHRRDLHYVFGIVID